MVSKNVIKETDRVIKQIWEKRISKDYDSYYLLKEDSLKCCLYYHLRRELETLLKENNLRIYPEFYFSELHYKADIAIVQIDPNSEEEHLAKMVLEVVAVLELKYTYGSSESTESWVKKDISKIKDYIQNGKLKCQFYFAVIYEVEREALNWLDNEDAGDWAAGCVTELNAGYIEDEMKFEVNSYNGLNE